MAFAEPNSADLLEAMRQSTSEPLDMGPEPCHVALAESMKNIEEGDLVELDVDELETLLPVQDLKYSMASNFYGEPSPSTSTAIFDPVVASTPIQQSLAFFEDQTAEINARSNILKPHEDNNYLLITIPENLATAPLFSTLPTLPLAPFIVNKIKESSVGSDGVFLPKTGLPSVRRPPLQVLEPNFKNTLPAPVVNKPVIPCKRKQQFKITRDDGIIFTDETVKSVQPQEIQLLELDDSFEWTDTASDDGSIKSKEKAKAAVKQSQCCPGCKKMFKKLSSHKCKDLSEELKLTPVKRSKPRTDQKCDSCKRFFRSESSYSNHIKSCGRTFKLMFCDYCTVGFKTKSGLKKHCLKCRLFKATTSKPFKPVPTPAVKIHPVFVEVDSVDVSQDLPKKRVTRSSIRQQN